MAYVRCATMIGEPIDVGFSILDYAGRGVGIVAYVPPDQREELERLDVARCVACLNAAAAALEAGDGIEATMLAAEAFARIGYFHKG